MRVFDKTDRIDDNTEGIIQLCKDWISPGMIMAEIGVYRGVATAIFAEYAKTVYAVDSWTDNPDYKELGQDLLESAELLFNKVVQANRNVIKCKGLSVNVARYFMEGELDAIYIDASHDEENFRADWEAWEPKVKKQIGLICGHDLNMIGNYFPEGVTVARQYPDQSWVVIK